MMCDGKFQVIVAINFDEEYYSEVLQRNESINAARYIEFLEKLHAKYPNNLIIMHDNARPHKA